MTNERKPMPKWEPPYLDAKDRPRLTAYEIDRPEPAGHALYRWRIERAEEEYRRATSANIGAAMIFGAGIF